MYGNEILSDFWPAFDEDLRELQDLENKSTRDPNPENITLFEVFVFFFERTEIHMCIQTQANIRKIKIFDLMQGVDRFGIGVPSFRSPFPRSGSGAVGRQGTPIPRRVQAQKW